MARRSSRSEARRSSPGEVEILTRLSDWPMDSEREGERFIVVVGVAATGRETVG